ncbi:arylformamidase [Tremella mesenterica]|uniref:Arylformamidase n=1 Tax=Tremella mesenterica TaxID=5217 RepID=A0A4Q1BTT4_TREME|nr:arylformamidase [Tremella mesenterica]
MTTLNFQIAQEVEATAPPPIPLAAAWGQTYLSSHPSEQNIFPGPLLNLSQGVPGDPPHPSLLSRLSETSSDPQAARYGDILGERVLREAVAIETNHRYSLPSSPSGHKQDEFHSELNNDHKHSSLNNDQIQSNLNNDQIHSNVNHEEKPTNSSSESDSKFGKGVITWEDVGITVGCNMAFIVLLHTLCTPFKSSILLPLPSYFNHTMSLSLHSVKPIFIPSLPENEFRPSLIEARKSLEKQSEIEPIKAIVLVSPNNPTGATYSPEELRDWYDLAKEWKVALIIDETYKDFVDGVPHDLFELEDWRGTLVSLGSFSKGYRIPGHRLGTIFANPYLLERIATICDCMQICPPRPPQLALAPLLPSLREDISNSRISLKNRMDLFVPTVQAVKGWKVMSHGGFFAYVEFPSYLPRRDTQGKIGSEIVSRLLAEECGVVTLPGSFFMPSLDERWQEGTELLKVDKWIRFAVANVGDEVIRQLGPRLEMMNRLMEY